VITRAVHSIIAVEPCNEIGRGLAYDSHDQRTASTCPR
jgi:hypothetical protein